MTAVPDIVVAEKPTDDDRAAVLKALVAHNDLATGRQAKAEPLAILIHDPVSKVAIGGLWGKSVYDWLFVEYLAIPQKFRGQDVGSAILTKAEEIARARGCIGVWLDTYSFQAPEFYKKQGYEIFGTIDDFPKGFSRHFLKKNLV